MKRFIDAMFGMSTVRHPFYDADGGADGSGGGDDDKGGDDDGGEGADKRTVTMTQAELDALIKREKGRVAKKYGDYDDLRTKLSALEKAEDERKKADMSEAERLKAEKDEADRKAQEAEGKATETLTKANRRLIKSEFKLEAKELGIRPDALDDAFVLADISAVKVDEDGNVEGVKAAVESLIQAKPYLVEAPKKEPKKIGEGSNHDDKSPQKTAEQLLAEAAEKARRSGRIEDRVAYAELKEELSKKK